MKVSGVTIIIAIIVLLLSPDVDSLIVPDEIPSILSVIYSNIPTIKKGTDSRLGWGFRLGERADFQVLVELGPQTNTQPLANQGDSGASKRNALENLVNTLYAQRQREKNVGNENVEKIKEEKNGEDWLKTWSKENEVKPNLGVGEIDAKSVIPDEKR